jgi:hypothetical protein
MYMNIKFYSLLMISFLAISCNLKRPSLKPEFPGTVSHLVACNGQNIKITWDVLELNDKCNGNQAACKRDPMLVEVSGTGGMSFKQSPAEFQGEFNGVVTSTEDITVTLHASDKDQDLGTSSVKINVLSPGEFLNLDAVCEGICQGDLPAWKEMQVDLKDIKLSDLIAIKQLTNTNAFDVELTVYYQNGETSTVNLKAGQSSSVFTSRIAKVMAKNKAEVNACGKGAPAPASINLQAGYGCL